MSNSISLNDLHRHIITWLSAANGNLNQEEKINLYKKLITEEYVETLQASSDAEEYSELMDLLWVIISYCYYKKYDVGLGLDALVRSNASKLIHPKYDPNTGKLLKNENYIRPDWKYLLEISRKEN